MKKNNFLLVSVFLSGCVLGGAGMFIWQTSHAPVVSAYCPARAELLLARLEEAGLPDGTQEVVADHTPKSSADLPSQLVRAELPADIIIGGEVSTAEKKEKPTGVVLSDGQNAVVLNAQKPAQRVADGTSITMIEAPVTLKRITGLEEYKQFKQVARGSYPTVDFSKEDVLILESQSNLPDKVFEIVDIVPEGENLKLRYRVNVFGLDKKVNTHSALKTPKTNKNIVLEQVL